MAAIKKKAKEFLAKSGLKIVLLVLVAVILFSIISSGTIIVLFEQHYFRTGTSIVLRKSLTGLSL